MEYFTPVDHYLPQNQKRWYQLKLLLYEHNFVVFQWENLVGRKILISKTPERKTRLPTINESQRNLVVCYSLHWLPTSSKINLHIFNVIAYHWSDRENRQITGFFMIITMTLNGSTVFCPLSLSVPPENIRKLMDF